MVVDTTAIQSMYGNVSIIVGLIASGIAYVAAHLPDKWKHTKNAERLSQIEDALVKLHQFQVDNAVKITNGLQIVADSSPQVAQALKDHNIEIQKINEDTNNFKIELAALLAQIQAQKAAAQAK